MSEYHFNLPRDTIGEHKLPVGEYDVTVFGLTGSEFISIDAYVGTTWQALEDGIHSDVSGIITKSSKITIPSSGRIKLHLSSSGNTKGAKIVFSRNVDLNVVDVEEAAAQALAWANKLPPTDPVVAPKVPPGQAAKANP